MPSSISLAYRRSWSSTNGNGKDHTHTFRETWGGGTALPCIDDETLPIGWKRTRLFCLSLLFYAKTMWKWKQRKKTLDHRPCSSVWLVRENGTHTKKKKKFIFYPKMMRGSSWHQDPQWSRCVSYNNKEKMFFSFLKFLLFCVCDDEPVTQRYFLLLFFYILYSPPGCYELDLPCLVVNDTLSPSSSILSSCLK